MGRQLQLATTDDDEVELLRFIRSLAPIRVFQTFARSTAELWLDDWETRRIPAAGILKLSIWPQTFP
jgi:allantoicase